MTTFSDLNQSIRQFLSLAWKTSSRAGGGAPDHWSDEPSLYGSEPEYKKMARDRDRRDDYAMQLAKERGRREIGAWAIAAILAGGWWNQAQKATVERVFVETNKEGDPVEVHYANNTVTSPTDVMMAGEVKRIIKAAFTKDYSLDPRDMGPINREFREYLRTHMVGQAVERWNHWNAENDAECSEREIRVLNRRQSVADRMVWNATWQLRCWQNGTARPWASVQGEFTFEYRKPSNGADVAKNEAGLFVTHMSVSTDEDGR